MNDLKDTFAFGVIGSCVGFIILLIITTSCSSPICPDPNESKYTKSNIEYLVFEIEGMPCVGVGRVNQYGYAGLSCDWSKWEGR